jgi:hypothetical protein
LIGARVVKTSLAVFLSILIARSLDLHTPHFAGIIAVLSVQPSIYRSLRYGLQHTISAVMGAAAGAYCLYHLGGSAVVMGVVAFLLMAVHVWIKWTNSLLVSVVIAINTLGTTSLFFGDSALHQLALVLIGTGVGTLINICCQPVHGSREEYHLAQSEGMLRSLLYYMYIDLVRLRVTAYPDMRKQIDEVKMFIEKGKAVSEMIDEDNRFRRLPRMNRLILFRTYESMAERIRDISKELQKVDVTCDETAFLRKAIPVLIRVQEQAIAKQVPHIVWLKAIIDNRRQALWKEPNFLLEIPTKLAFYNLYGYLLEYLRELGSLHEKYRFLAAGKRRRHPKREKAKMPDLASG